MTAGQGVVLPAATADGTCMKIINNDGADAVNVYPNAGDNLGAGVETAVALAAGSNIEYCSYDATNWEAF